MLTHSVLTDPNVFGAGTFTGTSCSDSVDMLSQNNMYRAMHQAPGVAWNEQLARESEAYAKVLAAKNCGLRHADTPYGENL